MAITASEEDRSQGLIYCDRTLSALPATHALVIGVGQYSSNRLSSVTSPPISARAITTWLLDATLSRASTGFNNPVCPLGSIATLLSEQPNGAHSEIEGAFVPRANFQNVKAAIRAWIARGRAHTDNFLFLFVSSHGESFGRRTAFLLEDYGSDEDDVTAGMSEIEQFVEALSNVVPKHQLLIFDCCRMPTELGLPFDQEFGSRLLNPSLPRNSIGHRPHILRSTGLGAEAFGEKNAPTLFTQALLEALRGLAASPNDRWTIDTYGLGQTTARLLELHVRDGEPLQVPESRLNRPFKVSICTPVDTATMFVSLLDEHEFSTSRIRVLDGTTLVEERFGRDERNRYTRIILPKYQARTIVAIDHEGKVIGETTIEPLPPVIFTKLPEELSLRQLIPETSAAPTSGRINLSVAWTGISTPVNVVATIRSNDATPDFNESFALTSEARSASASVASGRYAISIRASTGQVRQTEVNVHVGVSVDVQLDLSSLMSEAALAAKSVERDVSGRVDEAATNEDGTWRSSAWNWLTRIGANEANATTIDSIQGFAAPISRPYQAVPGLAEFDSRDGLSTPQFALNKLATNEPAYVSDRLDRRFKPHFLPTEVRLQHGDLPIWVAFVAPTWREITNVPSLGTLPGDEWSVRLSITHDARRASSNTFATVQSRQWEGLLAFLALRDFERSAIILDTLLGDIHARIAVFDKVENPLAALAGALVATACGRLSQIGVPQQWLENLANWFPGLPDGPIVLSRFLLQQSGNSPESRLRAKSLLLLALDRGIPIYSLAIDWLAEDLAALDGDPDVAVAARAARQLRRLSDPTRVFTTLRIPV
ncbi:hypothetical protein ACVIHC_004615 [Bradyrhizobium diazoefficiens]